MRHSQVILAKSRIYALACGNSASLAVPCSVLNSFSVSLKALNVFYPTIPRCASSLSEQEWMTLYVQISRRMAEGQTAAIAARRALAVERRLAHLEGGRACA